MNITLYGLASELRQLEEINDLESSEFSLEKQAILTTLVQSKIDAVCSYVNQQEDFLEAIDKRIKELQELKKNQTKKSERFNDYLLSCLDLLNTSKISGELYSIAYRKPVKQVEVYDESLLAPNLFRTKVLIEPDKEEIKRCLNNGEEIQGARFKDGNRNIKVTTGR